MPQGRSRPLPSVFSAANYLVIVSKFGTEHVLPELHAVPLDNHIINMKDGGSIAECQRNNNRRELLRNEKLKGINLA
jgi:hypothetical protein